MTEFLIGLVSGAVLLLLGQRITNAYKKKADQDALINDVAEKYHALRQANKTSGAHGLIEAGVLRFQNAAQIEEAINRIQAFGHSDPLGPNRSDLAHKDIHDFFRVLREKRLNPLQLSDLKQAYNLTHDI